MIEYYAMEAEPLAKSFEVLSQADPESQRRIQAIREGIERLHEVPAYKELLEGLDPTDVFEGNGSNDSSFQALLIGLNRGSERTRALRLNVYGDPKSRSTIVVDFMLALQRPPDVGADAHDDLGLNQDQVYWRMS